MKKETPQQRADKRLIDAMDKKIEELSKRPFC